ncbi:uncharacterized protein LOC130939916 [Arachis stenosperma]|uniref:uncharacterized protein LOC130939916 n=1 Tax=Arachis stenosperma TaxID=217475 RepID=UPI0025AC90AA|nr:uncharacterized protein LOC130939916 [Arachis stenosperma]
MKDQSDTQQHPRTDADLMAANAALLAENQRMAELLATMQNRGERKHVNKVTNAEQNEEHQSESNAKTEEMPPKTGRRRANPFSDEIMSFKMPQNFTLPMTLAPYKGIGDPKIHVTKFESMMFLNSDSDPILCRSFPTFLDGAALLWFSNLPACSISSFDDFSKLFINQFAASKIYVRDSDYLSTIRQGQHESLKDYMTRFTTAAMEIPDLNSEVQLHALKSGLRPGKFQEAIAVAKPKTLEEFRDKATGQIEIEELRETRRYERQPHRKEEDKTPTKDPKRPFRLTPKYDSYTRFNTQREDILKEILHNKLIKPPNKAGSYQDQRFVDKTKHCAFHQKFGHTTDECVIAKDLLERLARQRHLDKYISKARPSSEGSLDRRQERRQNTPENPKIQPPPPRGVINCISGGFASGGQTSSARKRHFREMLTLQQTNKTPTNKPRTPEISFRHSDYQARSDNLDDPVVISIQAGDLLVKKALLDPGSSVDVLFYSTFKKMKLSEQTLLPSSGELIGFSGERVSILDSVWLKTTLGEHPMSKTKDLQFLVVDCISPYNIILGRPFLNTFCAIVSTIHLCMKFQVRENLIATIHSDHIEARRCYNESLRIKAEAQQRAELTQETYNIASISDTADLDPRGDLQDKPTPIDELEKVQLDDNINHYTHISSSLLPGIKQKITKLLQENADLFSWTPADMPGINPSLICHKLQIDPRVRPVSQKKCNTGDEKREACLAETKKLLQAGFIEELRFTTWLSNVVMVRKTSGKWRMCVDFTNLNKACPKDAYPLPCIDKLVDNASGYNTLSFLDAYSGYNQILMHPKDKDKIAFITELGNYCYTVMPFGLKNAGATYQRLMDKVFNQQIERNLEVYVDDMVVKTKQEHTHELDLQEVFGQLRRSNMRLNPEKCAFGVKGGKFLGFMLTSRGIEANPEKCEAIINMRSPRTIKEVQQLNGRLAALSRFLPAVSSHSQHFFNILKGQTKFNWSSECETAFQKLKSMILSPPILQKPNSEKPLSLYLSISQNAISSVLVTEIRGKYEPVYFVSKTLQHAELRYPPMEKLAYALVLTARRLRHYFQSNKIIVKTNQPLRQILTRPEVSGRLTKWSIELSEFDVAYELRTTIKAQFLADFLAELTGQPNEEYSWELYVDGASNAEGSGAGVYLTNKHDLQAEQSIRFSFQTSNNQAEYEALLAGLRLAQSLNITHLQVYCDSQLIVQQVNGNFQVKDQLLEKYHTLVRELISQFNSLQITHIAREQNTRADALSKLATTRKNMHESVISQLTLAEPSFSNKRIYSISQEEDWRIAYEHYLQTGHIPSTIKDNKAFKRRASSFTLIGTTLYKRGFSQPLLRCLTTEEAKIAMDEAHEGVCGNHIGGISLASKVARAGYYWPTMKSDCIQKVRKCESCQKHAPLIHNPAENLHSSEVSWPFHKWGLDILGPFPKVPGQFTDQSLAEFLQGFKIKHHFSSVEHPQSNGLAEAANKVILIALKKKLGDAKGEWAELIPEVLWSYNTTKQTTTNETPYRLVYGANAMIPIEIALTTTRSEIIPATHNDNIRQIELDTIEEERYKAELKHKAMQSIIKRKYNKTVKPRSFGEQDLVLRRTEEARKPPTHGKLAATWEGPYRVTKVLGKGAYKLQTIQGTDIPGIWNVSSLKAYIS